MLQFRSSSDAPSWDGRPTRGAHVMSERSLRGKVAVVGVGETTYYKHSQSPDPEFVLALKAILAACADALQAMAGEGVDKRTFGEFDAGQQIAEAFV